MVLFLPRRCFVLAIFFAATISLHSLGTRKPLAQFGQQSWQSDSGLPQNTVHAVLQTRDGFVWIATEAGLVRFDGLNFRVYDTENTPQLRSELINDLKEDSSGTLWISTTSGLVSYNAGAFALFTVAEGLPSNTVSATCLPRRGPLLALTPAGIAVLRDGRFQRVPGTENLSGIDPAAAIAEENGGQTWIAGNREIFALAADGSKGTAVAVDPGIGDLRAVAVMRPGELWVGGRGGVDVLRPSGSTRLTHRERLPSDEVTALLPDGTGGMWIGTSRGLARWNNGSTTAIVAPPELEGLAIQRLYKDREGTLWVGTSRGVARVANGIMDLVPRRSRLHGVLSIFEDREGSMWFGTDNAGVTVLREQAFSTVSEQEGLSASLVRAIFQSRDGAIWIGTDGGGLNRIDHGRVSSLVSHPALSSDVVLSVAEAGADLWVGTPNGLNRVRNGVVRVFSTEDGLADDFVRSLYVDRDGSLWIGTRNGLSHLVGGVFTSYSSLDGLGSDLIGAILRSREGDLWVGTLGGLSRMRGNGFENFTVKNGLGGDAVTSMLEDSNGILWIGSQGGGLSRRQDGRFSTFAPVALGLPETIFGILEDSSGDLWLSSRKGIDRVRVSDLDRPAAQPAPDVRGYGVADGMRISEASSGGHPAAWRMRDGSLWFATLDGAAFVTPESTAVNLLPPPTVIEQILLNDRPIDPARLASMGTLVAPPGGTRFTVQYAGLSFVAPQRVRYRYRLQGFDKGWVDAGARREAFYTNVPPGTYRFLVESSNNDGVWSPRPTGFDLRVQPTLLQTRWFYALLALALGAIAFALYRWRVLSVEAQYKAVLQERGRIAREIHDTLAQGYVAVAVQLEVTARLLETSKEAALRQLEETRSLVRGSLAEARSSIWNLRSQNEAETLPSLLAAMTESRSTEDGPHLKLEVKGTYRPVARSVEKEILRVAQEAVANALRHGHARHIQVRLRYDFSTLQLLVSDDGVGFQDPSRDLSGSGHFGLQGMRERAAAIGATLQVESRPGKGTIVDLQMDPRKAEREGRL